MSNYLSGFGYSVEVDIDWFLPVPTETPDFQDLGETEVSESLNEAVSTFFRLKDGGLATNVITAIDVEYSITTKGDKTNLAIVAIYENKLNIAKRNNVPFKFVDNFSEETLTAQMSITGISDTKNSDVLELAITVKFYDPSSIIVTPNA